MLRTGFWNVGSQDPGRRSQARCRASVLHRKGGRLSSGLTIPRVDAPQGMLRIPQGMLKILAEAQPSTNASTRSGLPLPLTILSGAAMTTAPVAGS